MATCSTDTLQASACTNGFSKLSEGDKWAILLQLLCEIASGGGSGSGAVLEYTTTDPTTDGVTPTNQNNPAIAYKRDGTGNIYVWNTVAHTWG